MELTEISSHCNYSRYPRIAEEAKEFSAAVARVIEATEERKDCPRKEACQILEKLLSILHDFGYDMARLKAEASTTAGPGMRQVYETALGKQILNLYRADKDLFGEIKVLRDEECVDAMRPPTRDAVQWCREYRAWLPDGQF